MDEHRPTAGARDPGSWGIGPDVWSIGPDAWGMLREILAAPDSALAGVSEGDATLLKDAFNIATVGDLGKNRYFRAAQLLSELAEAGAE